MDTRRLFFALWPDQSVRTGVIERRKLLGGADWRAVPEHNLHLTLLFLGNQPAGRVDEIQEFAGTISTTSMTLCLDHFGWFRRAGVVWLGGKAPDAARILVEKLAVGMADLGLDFQVRPFVPHITLFRRVRASPRLPKPAPLVWDTREFALIESLSSRPYQVLRKWPVE